MANLLLNVLVICICVLGAQSALALCPGEAEQHLKSRVGDYAVEIVFENQTSTSMHLYWLDYDGNRESIGDILPKQTVRHSTYVTHPWVVAKTGEDCVGVYFPDGQLRTIVLKGSYNVNAGPLQNGKHARTTCPEICALWEAEWTGSWKTTIPGKMSVCECKGVTLG